MNENVTAIVCAAGSGKRAGFDKNKVLVPLLGIPLLERSVCALLPYVDEIIVSANARDFDELERLRKKYGFLLVEGGETRTLSVFNALKKASGDVVLVHDGARPFLTGELVASCIESVKKYGSGVCAVPVVDTVAIAENGEICSYPDRANTFAIQTPQGFRTKELLAAYEKAILDGKRDFTDDSSLFRTYVRSPKLCAGDKNNRKLTYREDFFASTARVGFGADTHAFGKEQNYIMLGGVKVPSESGLIAHSDGDVLLHALMDALLSAAGLNDIGHYFPDTDDTWKGADSTLLLKETLKSIEQAGFLPENVSIAVQAEKPRLARYIGEIRASLSALLSLPISCIGVSAGTNEKLGYVGEGKGITVYAAALLRKKD